MSVILLISGCSKDRLSTNGNKINPLYYTHKDKEVLNGIKKRGDIKDGEQMHIQVIVSRKDATNKIKLSPMNKSRGKNEQHSKKLGQFNRVAFKQSGETLFNDLFGFDRNFKETMAYANNHKNGSMNQREQLITLELGAELNTNSKFLSRSCPGTISIYY